MQPAGQTIVNAAEVLIGTDFYSGFTISSDCRCAKMYSDTEPSATSSVSGAISGILNYWDVGAAGQGYQYLMPKSVSAFPVSNTVAGM
jgi:hypothetical protein